MYFVQSLNVDDELSVQNELPLDEPSQDLTQIDSSHKPDTPIFTTTYVTTIEHDAIDAQLIPEQSQHQNDIEIETTPVDNRQTKQDKNSANGIIQISSWSLICIYSILIMTLKM